MNVRSYCAIGVLCLATILPRVAWAQGPTAAPDKAAANSAYEAKDWPKAVTLYEGITKAEPENGRAWYRLGVVRRNLKQHEQAIAAFQKASDAGVLAFYTDFEIALCYSAEGNKEKALQFLEQATAHGYADTEQVKTSPELDAVRGEPRFAAVLEKMERAEKPCAYSTESRQFDFWVGEWDVFTTDGSKPAGRSRIERVLSDCVILENWKSNGSAYEGKSYNTYNIALKRWEQFWVDNSQGMVHFYGKLLANGVMDYYTDAVPQPDGTKLKRHLEFIPFGPDKVRQVSHGSTDGGKTWKPEYDFTYNRRK